MASFTEKQIRVTFTKDSGFASAGGSHALVLTGLRVSALVKKDGVTTTFDVAIYGMTPAQINDLSTFGKPFPLADPNTKITLEAGDASGLAGLFTGSIVTAWQMFADQPETYFHVTGFDTWLPQLTPVVPISYPSGADVATIMQGLAKTMGLKFQNNGVVGVQLSTPYYWGSAYDQMQEVKQDAGINAIIDDGTLVIWPRGGARTGPAPIISPATGMIDYPISTQNGVQVSTLLNPAITYGVKVVIQGSQIQQANGTWVCYGVEHMVQSVTPGGEWRTKAVCWNLGVIGAPGSGA